MVRWVSADLLAAALTVGAGCPVPLTPPGELDFPCSSSADCLEGYLYVGGRCTDERQASAVDGGVVDAGGRDLAAAEAGDPDQLARDLLAADRTSAVPAAGAQSRTATPAVGAGLG